MPTNQRMAEPPAPPTKTSARMTGSLMELCLPVRDCASLCFVIVPPELFKEATCHIELRFCLCGWQRSFHYAADTTRCETPARHYETQGRALGAPLSLPSCRTVGLGVVRHLRQHRVQVERSRLLPRRELGEVLDLPRHQRLHLVDHEKVIDHPVPIDI